MISKYSIQNKFLTVNINRLGAELCSVIDSEGTEFIWQAGEVWPKHAPNLFPIVGSLLDHEYTYQGETYSLSHHGFARNKNLELLHQSEHIIAIPGTRSVPHFLEHCAGARLSLSKEAIAQIESVLPVGWAHGDRYSQQQWIGPERYC